MRSLGLSGCNPRTSSRPNDHLRRRMQPKCAPLASTSLDWAPVLPRTFPKPGSPSLGDVGHLPKLTSHTLDTQTNAILIQSWHLPNGARITRAAALPLASRYPKPNSPKPPLAMRRDSGVGCMRLLGSPSTANLVLDLDIRISHSIFHRLPVHHQTPWYTPTLLNNRKV